MRNLAVAVILGLTGSALAQLSPQALTVPGPPSALSGSGRFVCGSATGNAQGFRWSRELGLQLLTPTPSTDHVWVRGIDDNGSTIGERYYTQNVFGTPTLFRYPVRWASAGSMTDLPAPFPGQSAYAYALGISHSGAVVVGGAQTQLYSSLAVTWTAPTFGYTLVPPATTRSEARAVSGDGSVVTGVWLSGTPYKLRPFRWSQAGGWVDLPPLADASTETLAASLDGSVIVGITELTGIPLRWDGTVLTQLPSLPGLFVRPTGVSGDGSIIVGNATGPTAVIWESTGIRTLSSYLLDHGVSLTGWVLSTVAGVSRDGLTFAGSGAFNGVSTNWIVTLSCYANCDNSTVAPILNVNDFTCFLNTYAAGSAAANCDNSTTIPILNVNDFTCFLNKYAAGWP